MKLSSRSTANSQRLSVIAILVSASVVALAQQQPPTVTRPTGSSAQATPRKTNSPFGSVVGTPVDMKRAAGTITGFVYWQMSVLQPQSDCQGLTIKVVTVSKSGMPLQLLATTNTFTAMGPLTDYSAQGAPKYMLCSYSLHNMPENVSLRTLLYGPPPKTFVIPAAFQIPGGTTCASSPQSTLSFILTAGETLCGDGAFNINFKLDPTGMTRPPVTAAPQGMLLPATPRGAQTQSNSQLGAPGQLLLSKPSGGGTVQLNPQPLLPKGTGPSQTMSAGSMASSGMNSSPAQRSNRPVNAVLYSGTVSGYIYWDTSKTGFESSCNGVSVHANLDHGNWFSWQGGADNLTYSANGPLAVCAYTITGVPTGVPLDISPEVGWPYTTFGVNLFSLAAPGNQSGGSVAWGGEFLGEYDVITVQKTSCSALVGSKNFGSQSNLQSGPRSCGNQATNVNLILVSIKLSNTSSGTAGLGATSRVAGAKRGGPNRILLYPQPASSAAR